jgi:D-psicose/D-tagatose/L-ribulose 3-epimerase
MKFGINTFLWTANFDQTHLDLLPQIKGWGFDGVEIGQFAFETFPAAEVRRSLEQNDLEAVFCTALTGNASLGSPDSAIRQSTRETLAAAIRGTANTGAKVLAGPFCSAVGLMSGARRTEDEWKRAVEGLASLAPILDECKVTLAVEPLNRFETYFLNTVEDGVKLCEAINHPRIGLLFDTFHANIEEKHLGHALRACGKWVKHIHTCENDRGTPGSGHIEWNDVFAAMKDIGYSDWAVIETFGSRIPEIAMAACIWRDLAPVSESIAYDGLKFLKGKQEAYT